VLPVTVSPQSATDATSGAGGIGSAAFNFGANPNLGFLTGGGGSLPLIIAGIALVLVLVRR
jgi:hypothetical protein